VSVTPHILIADADADTRNLYREVLAHVATIDEAADGADALAKALRQPPTLVITEVRLPYVDGYALCTRLRAAVTTRDTKIVVVTASLSEPAVGRAADAGADGVLVKPCAIDLLCARVDDLLRQARGVSGDAVPQADCVAADVVRAWDPWLPSGRPTDRRRFHRDDRSPSGVAAADKARAHR